MMALNGWKGKMGFGETTFSLSQMFISSQPQAHGMASEPSGEERCAEVEGTVPMRTLCDIWVQRMPPCKHWVGKKGFTSIRAGPQGSGDSGELRRPGTWSAEGLRALEQHSGSDAGTRREGTLRIFQQQWAARAEGRGKCGQQSAW